MTKEPRDPQLPPSGETSLLDFLKSRFSRRGSRRIEIPAVPDVEPVAASALPRDAKPAQEIEAAPATRLAPAPEPSVLDYLKSILSRGRERRIEIPPEPAAEAASVNAQAAESPIAPIGPPGAVNASQAAASTLSRLRTSGGLAAVPWRSLFALGLALLGQLAFEPPGVSGRTGSIYYAAAAILLIWGIVRGELSLAPWMETGSLQAAAPFRRTAFIASIALAVLAFLFFTDNLFTRFNVSVWLLSLALLLWSLWARRPDAPPLGRTVLNFLTSEAWSLKISRWTLLILLVSGFVVFFRVYHLQQTPGEPFSDHAEKLLDIYDVSQGQTSIFFPRNTGREAFQMYWTLLMSWIFGTGLSYMSLKIGTVLIGLLTLPYIYLLGKEVGGARAGLLALFLAGVGYWPNVISRSGLRFPLYPLFVAPLMYYFVRGLGRRNRNDFLLAGLFLGLGLHGYVPYRIVPVLVLVGFSLYVIHAQSKGSRRSVPTWLLLVALVSLMVFLPLMRYAIGHPENFSMRALSRLGTTEQPLPAPWYDVLLSNTWNAVRMFNWDNGTIWVHSLPNRPAMDVVTAALFLIGVVLLVVRYAQRRHWLDLFLLISILILLLPSILSLAFPGENPALNRTGGALVPAFVIAGLGLDALIGAMTPRRGPPVAAYAAAVVLLWISAANNFHLVFRQFDGSFRASAWNSSEMGAIIKQFGQAYGGVENAWVIPFPYWVDTRLVGVWAGIPNRDFGMWAEDLESTTQVSGAKLFIAKANVDDPAANDQAAVDKLKQLYPQGSLALHPSPVEGHDFWIYFVPASSGP